MDIASDTPVAGSISIYVRAAALIAVAAIALRFLIGTNSDRLLPTWVPIEIFIASTCIQAGGIWLNLLSFFRRYGGSLFGFTKSHQVIHKLDGMEKLMSNPHHTLDNEPIGWSICHRVFGADNNPELHEKLKAANKDLFNAVERGFMHESNSLGAIRAADVSGKASSLVTLTPSSLKLWERAAQHRLVVPETSDQAGAAEVNLFNLIRDFGALISIPILYGSDFCNRYPELLDDFWLFDNNCFPALLAGCPSWIPLKFMRDGIAARSRMLKALTELYDRLDKRAKGEAVDADLSDVGQVAIDRSTAYTKHGFSIRNRGDVEIALLWGQNANTQPLIFWFIVYIYSTPGLLASLRAETAPHVRLSSSSSHAPQITELDYPALSRDCPLFKSAYLETFRCANDASSLRYVARPLTVRDGALTHTLRPGTFITVPHGLAQRDPELFPDPQKFVPDRFVEVDEAGRRVARYGSLKPWGVGTGMCKGRTFAEKEILGVVASVIALWDFEPVGGVWKVPDALPGTGVVRPKDDVRVVARRRVV